MLYEELYAFFYIDLPPVSFVSSGWDESTFSGLGPMFLWSMRIINTKKIA